MVWVRNSVIDPPKAIRKGFETLKSQFSRLVSLRRFTFYINPCGGVMSLDLRLDEYLYRFESQDKVGLLVLDEEDSLGQVADRLTENDLHEARSWWSALTRLASSEQAFVILDTNLNLEIFDIVEQVYMKQREIIIIDKSTREVQRVAMHGGSGKLLLVTTKSQLEHIERVFPLSRKVGICESI